VLRLIALTLLVAAPRAPTQADCPPGTTLQRHENDGTTFIGCSGPEGADGPMIRLDADGGVVEAGHFVNRQREGVWWQRRNGRLVEIAYVSGREGPMRPCPPGSSELVTCVARCCDVSARMCVAPDGGLVGPWDEWEPGGRRLRSNLDQPDSGGAEPDPTKPAPFAGLGVVRERAKELVGPRRDAQPPK